MASFSKPFRIVVTSSITNTLNDTKLDKIKPYSFIEFLGYAKTLDRSIVDFNSYQQYLKDWNGVATTKFDDLETQVQAEFIACLKSIVLDYSTSEERKFISNVDFTDKNDAEVAVPFFASKIKQIILYFAEKRNTYAYDLQLAKNKGSITGVENFVKSSIRDILFSNRELTTTPLSSIEPHVKIEEGYDRFNDYFDIDPTQNSQTYFAEGNRDKYFSSNVNGVDPDVEIDLDNAIVTQINKYGVALTELPGIFINVDTPDLDLLDNSEFLDYSTRSRSNLRVLYEIELAKRLLATDYYYLSTNSVGESLTGKLFDGVKPFANLLNIHNPTTVQVVQPSIEYERDHGLFFKPTYKSILKLQTPFTHSISQSLPPDTVFVYPDPDQYGNVVGVSKIDYNSPLSFSQRGLDIQKNISSNNAIGNTLVVPKDFTFDSYLSTEQHQPSFDLSEFSNAGVLVSQSSDIFGNVIACFKQGDADYIAQYDSYTPVNSANTYLSGSQTDYFAASVKSLTGSGTFANTSSVLATPKIGTQRVSSTFTNKTSGAFYVLPIQPGAKFQPISAEFVEVFAKYPAITHELQGALISVDVFNSTYTFTTSGHVVIDKVEYTTTFKKSANVPLILNNTVNYATSNVFNIDDNLFVMTAEIDQLNPMSASNVRTYLFKFYAYDLTTGSFTQYLFENKDRVFFETLSQSNLESMILSYNSKFGQFTLVANLKDTNRNLFVYIKNFTLAGGAVRVMNNKIYVPNSSNFTYNFFSFENLEYTTLLTLEPAFSIVTFISSYTLPIYNGKLLF